MKRRLAYFSPLPPAHTGIADYSRELLPHLARLADVSLFTDQHLQAPAQELAGFATFPPDEYARRRWDYDIAIYQMGNSRYHESIGRTLLRYPGMMVLHDYGLHQLWAGQTIARGERGPVRARDGVCAGRRGRGMGGRRVWRHAGRCPTSRCR